MRFVDEVLKNSSLKKSNCENAVEFLNNLVDQSLDILPSVNIYYCKIIQVLVLNSNLIIF